MHNESGHEEAEKFSYIMKTKMNNDSIHLDEFLTVIEECDPNGKRVSEVGKRFEIDSACYETLYQEKKTSRVVFN